MFKICLQLPGNVMYFKVYPSEAQMNPSETFLKFPACDVSHLNSWLINMKSADLSIWNLVYSYILGPLLRFYSFKLCNSCLTAVISCFNSCLTAVPTETQPFKLKFGTVFNFMTLIKIPRSVLQIESSNQGLI